MGSITLLDWVIWLVYGTLFVLLFWMFQQSKKESYYQYFIPGLGIKIFGGLAFALIYVYYYKFGDTFLYYRGAYVLSNTIIDSPVDYIRLLLSENNNLPPDLHAFSDGIAYSRTEEEWFMVKLISPLTFLAFNSYLVLTLMMSIISFYGAWKLFLVFRDILPQYEKYAFYAVFLTPTVLFWGGGIMKDTITLAAINLVIYHFYFFGKKGGMMRNFWSVAIMIVCSLVIYKLKAYVLLAFIPGFVFALYLRFKQRIQNPIIRFVLGPMVLTGLVAISFLGIQNLSESSTKYSADNLRYQVKGFHSWHTDVGGSTYSLGDVEYTPTGVLSKLPQALNVTYFRPYLWEARNPVVLIGAVESLIIFILFLVALYRVGWKFFKRLNAKPILMAMFLYCLIFGFAVGFTSYNFGALARYKIPVLSLFVFILLYLLHVGSKPDDKKQLSE